MRGRRCGGHACGALALGIGTPALRRELASTVGGIRCAGCHGPGMSFMAGGGKRVSFTNCISVARRVLRRLSGMTTSGYCGMTRSMGRVLSNDLALGSSRGLSSLLRNVGAGLGSCSSGCDCTSKMCAFGSSDRTLCLRRLVGSSCPRALAARHEAIVITSFGDGRGVTSVVSRVGRVPKIVSMLSSIDNRLLVGARKGDCLGFGSRTVRDVEVTTYETVFAPASFEPSIRVRNLSMDKGSCVFASGSSCSFFGATCRVRRGIVTTCSGGAFVGGRCSCNYFMVPGGKLLHRVRLGFISGGQVEIGTTSKLIRFCPTSCGGCVRLLSRIHRRYNRSLDVRRPRCRPSITVGLLDSSVDCYGGICGRMTRGVARVIPSFATSFRGSRAYRILGCAVRCARLRRLTSFRSTVGSDVALCPSLLAGRCSLGSRNGAVLSFRFSRRLGVGFRGGLEGNCVGRGMGLVGTGRCSTVGRTVSLTCRRRCRSCSRVGRLEGGEARVLGGTLGLKGYVKEGLGDVGFRVDSRFVRCVRSHGTRKRIREFVRIKSCLRFPVINGSSRLRELTSSVLQVAGPGRFCPRSGAGEVPTPTGPELYSFLFSPECTNRFSRGLRRIGGQVARAGVRGFLGSGRLRTMTGTISTPSVTVVRNPPNANGAAIVTRVV